jgi:hypothetical protein
MSATKLSADEQAASDRDAWHRVWVEVVKLQAVGSRLDWGSDIASDGTVSRGQFPRSRTRRDHESRQDRAGTRRPDDGASGGATGERPAQP